VLQLNPMYELLSNPLMTYTHIAAKASVIRPAMHSVIIVFFQVRLRDQPAVSASKSFSHNEDAPLSHEQTDQAACSAYLCQVLCSL